MIFMPITPSTAADSTVVAWAEKSIESANVMATLVCFFVVVAACVIVGMVLESK
jgi:hypothetical protein